MTMATKKAVGKKSSEEPLTTQSSEEPLTTQKNNIDTLLASTLITELKKEGLDTLCTMHIPLCILSFSFIFLSGYAHSMHTIWGEFEWLKVDCI